MKEELIKYVMQKADRYYSDDFPICLIEDWIREFYHYQPERTNPEDAQMKIIKEVGNVLRQHEDDLIEHMRCSELCE